METFCADVKRCFDEATDRENGFTCDASYVVHVPNIGVVASLSMYVSDPWTWTSAELLVLADSERDLAEQRLIELEAKCRALADHESRLAAATMPDASYFGLPNAPDFPLGKTKIRRDGKTVDVAAATTEERTRREAALQQSMDRFDAAAAKMMEVYGFRLPKHVAVYDAFCRSLSDLERRGLDILGRSPGGIMVWFEEDGPERETRDGLDARLDCRFRCDPPELVTLMWGDSDGLHLGLWYDDPAELPSFIAGNWARDSAETSRYELTAIKTLLHTVEDRLQWDEEFGRFAMGAVCQALRWFDERDDEVLAEDGISPWTDAEHPDLLGSIGCALPEGSGDPRAGGWQATSERKEVYRNEPDQLAEWIAEARTELADGKPAYLMTLGRELHWLDHDDTRELAGELMAEAYRALGRDKLAEIVEVHHANRDLSSVAVY